ncbi:hypothetical protein JXI42_06785 [bacterium]|nr:hypothetical protein [bacterium]
MMNPRNANFSDNDKNEYWELLKIVQSPALVLDWNLKVVFCNEAFSSMLANPSGELSGIDAGELFAGFSDSETYNSIKIVLNSGESTEVEDQFLGYFWRNQVCKIPGGVLVLLYDITELKMAEIELGRSGEKTEALLNAIPDQMFQISRDGTFLNYKGQADSFLEFNNGHIGGKIDEIFSSELVGILNFKMKLLFKCNETQQFEFKQLIDDQQMYFEGRMVISGENIALVIVRDITDQKEAKAKLITYQHRLRSLTARLSRVEEEERRRIANVLHDNIGQVLALANIQLEKLRKSLSLKVQAETIDAIIDSLRSAIKETRQLTWELSPRILYELGLGAAVEELLNEVGEKHGLAVRFDEQGEHSLVDYNIRSMLFQGVRELLVNVVKHSKAREVSVLINITGETVEVQITDDGIGFHFDQLRSGMSRGFGLFNIRERLDYIGGNFYMESEPGKGTRVTLTAPIKHKDELKGEY